MTGSKDKDVYNCVSAYWAKKAHGDTSVLYYSFLQSVEKIKFVGFFFFGVCVCVYIVLGSAWRVASGLDGRSLSRAGPMAAEVKTSNTAPVMMNYVIPEKYFKIQLATFFLSLLESI